MREHLKKIEEQLVKGSTIGRRGTPVVSFWAMRDKWKKYGQYWELWGTDGDVEVENRVIDGARMAISPLMAPAELKLIYFVIPETDIVCQLAYEHDPEEPETGKTAIRRNNRIGENMRRAIAKIKEQVA